MSNSSALCRIIGIDPGLRATGWGVIDQVGYQTSFVACGVIRAPTSDDLAVRLRVIFDALIKVMSIHQPHEASVEKTFVNQNPNSALLLGMARGVILLAPASKDIPVFEYSANHIKKSVVGSGHADKHQVRSMIGCLLPGMPHAALDAADALASALCHAHHRPLHKYGKISKSS